MGIGLNWIGSFWIGSSQHDDSCPVGLNDDRDEHLERS